MNAEAQRARVQGRQAWRSGVRVKQLAYLGSHLLGHCGRGRLAVLRALSRCQLGKVNGRHVYRVLRRRRQEEGSEQSDSVCATLCIGGHVVRSYQLAMGCAIQRWGVGPLNMTKRGDDLVIMGDIRVTLLTERSFHLSLLDNRTGMPCICINTV